MLEPRSGDCAGEAAQAVLPLRDVDFEEAVVVLGDIDFDEVE
jgi:hypothetical protein